MGHIWATKNTRNRGVEGGCRVTPSSPRTITCFPESLFLSLWFVLLKLFNTVKPHYCVWVHAFDPKHSLGYTLEDLSIYHYRIISDRIKSIKTQQKPLKRRRFFIAVLIMFFLFSNLFIFSECMKCCNNKMVFWFNQRKQTLPA